MSRSGSVVVLVLLLALGLSTLGFAPPATPGGKTGVPSGGPATVSARSLPPTSGAAVAPPGKLTRLTLESSSAWIQSRDGDSKSTVLVRVSAEAI